MVFYHLSGTPDAEALQGREGGGGDSATFSLRCYAFPFYHPLSLPPSLAGSPKIYSERVDLLMASFLPPPPPTDLLFAGG